MAKKDNRSTYIAAGVAGYLLYKALRKKKSREQLIAEIKETCAQIPGCVIDEDVLEKMPRESLERVLDELEKKL